MEILIQVQQRGSFGSYNEILAVGSCDMSNTLNQVTFVVNGIRIFSVSSLL